MVPGFGFFQFIEDGLGHGGCELLGGESVSAAHQVWKPWQPPILEALHQGCEYVLVEGFSRCARFLGAVEHGDGCHVGG